MRQLALVLISGLVACAGPDSGPVPDVEPYWTPPCGDSCGKNGGVIGGSPFSGFWLTGVESDDHIKYLHFATSYANMLAHSYASFDVEGALLRWGPDPGHWHDELVGGVFAVGIGTKTYYVLIAEVHFHDGSPYWTKVWSGSAERYRLMWVDSEDPNPTNFADVCPVVDQVDDDLWTSAINAFAFEGESYDPIKRTISPTATAPLTAWVNIACEGSIPAKQLLSRRTTASSDGATYVSSIANDRQALVHAWAAEYCGPGPSFTHSGHKLRLRDRKGWFPQIGPVGWSDASPPLVDGKDCGLATCPRYEAVWDANGAVCLDTPRMAVPDPVGTDDNIEGRIPRYCNRPPRCSDQSWFPDHWTDHGLILSATFP